MKKKIWHDVPHHSELKVGQYVVPNFVSNSVWIQSDDNQAVVISPGQSLLETRPLSKAASDVHLHIVFPNGYHFMGVKAWQKAFPNHTLYASRRAIKMLEKKFEGASEIIALEEATPPLPKDYCVKIPPGHRGGDAWFIKESDEGDTWITCDSFLNYDRLSNQPIARLLQKWLDAAPGLKMSKVIKFLILSDRRSFKVWVLDQLAKRNVTTLIPSYGEIQPSERLGTELTSLIKRAL